MMTPEEIERMDRRARMTILVADTEEWSETDDSRILANLAIKAGDELARLVAENERLREALVRIAADNPATPGEWLTNIQMVDIAIEALQK